MWFNWFKKKEEEVKPLLIIDPPQWYRFIESINPNEIATHVTKGGYYKLKNKSSMYTAPTYIQVWGDRSILSSFINIKCFEELTPEHSQILEMLYSLDKENGKANNNY